MASSFCECVSTDDGVVHVKLTGEDEHHYLTKEGLEELRLELSRIRELASSEPSRYRGLITTSSGGSFCDGIHYGRLRMGGKIAKPAKEISDGMAAVVRELMSMPMPTVCAAIGSARSLGFALALAHDQLVVLSGGSYGLLMVENGVAVEPHVAALLREKTDQWYVVTTLKSRPRNGDYFSYYGFADGVAGSPEDVKQKAQKLIDDWTGHGHGEVLADTRKKLYWESWNAVSAIVP